MEESCISVALFQPSNSGFFAPVNFLKKEAVVKGGLWPLPLQEIGEDSLMARHQGGLETPALAIQQLRP